jgi:hypothetical protein
MSEALRSSGVTGERLPEDLELMPPGARLASLLAGVDRAALSDRDRVRLLRARNRLSAHIQAELLADIYAVSQDDDGVDEDAVSRHGAPSRYPWAASEVAFALRWTETAAGARLEQARQLVEDLPRVFAALRAGDVDMPKVLVIGELAGWLDDREVARRLVEQVIDRAADLTTGQLRAKLRQLVLAVDPQAARRRCARALRTRRVESFPNPDGTGEVWGRSLPPQDAAAAWERLTAIARAARSAGDERTMDQLRADALLDLLVGEGVATGGPVGRHLAGLPEADGHPWDGDPAGPPPPPTRRSTGEAAKPAGAHADVDVAVRSGACAGEGGGEAARAVVRVGAGVGSGAGEDAEVGEGAVVDSAWDPAWPTEPDHDRLTADQIWPHPAGPPVDSFDDAGQAFDGDHLWPPDWPGRWHNDPAVTAARAGSHIAATSGSHTAAATGDAPSGRNGGTAGPMPGPRRGAVELLLPLSTALGHDHLPGELVGWGPVLADIARHVAAEQTDAQWRYSAYNRIGELQHHGILTARPTTSETARPSATSRRAAAGPAPAVAGQASPPSLPQPHARQPAAGRTSRRPTAAVAALVTARNRTCTPPAAASPPGFATSTTPVTGPAAARPTPSTSGPPADATTGSNTSPVPLCGSSTPVTRSSGPPAAACNTSPNPTHLCSTAATCAANVHHRTPPDCLRQEPVVSTGSRPRSRSSGG